MPVYWYGVCYAVGLALAYIVITREARRRGLDARLVDNGIIIVAIAALVGGRLYHVIDQWQLYKDDLAQDRPPALHRASASTAGSSPARSPRGTSPAAGTSRSRSGSTSSRPACSSCRRSAAWGNFFNQELYGPPTNLPWGIAIDCAHRVGRQYPCALYPEATTGFQPLFLYESLSGAIGAVTLLWIARRFGSRMRPGDLFLIFFIWYAVVRFALETLRVDNWTFFGIPTAMVVSAIADRRLARAAGDPPPAGRGLRAVGRARRRARTSCSTTRNGSMTTKPTRPTSAEARATTTRGDEVDGADEPADAGDDPGADEDDPGDRSDRTDGDPGDAEPGDRGDAGEPDAGRGGDPA